MIWTLINADETLSRRLSTELGVSEVMGRLLVQRGLESVKEAEAYLRPRLAFLRDPFELKDLAAAVARMEQAIQGRESVVVFGDYDVDGVTSVVQLVSLLRRQGLEPRCCVPLRLDEGYGLSRDAMDRAFAGKVPDLFIALDCGTNSHEEIAWLRGLGCDVIIVDHHQARTVAPVDCILINPHVNDPEGVPWKHLCTAGLVFKLLHGLIKSRRNAGDPGFAEVQLKDYLDLVGMGTVADLVPLKEENRILSWFGLRHLRASERSGIGALAEICKIDSCREITSSDISFKLAPRINASGRLADAILPVTLLLSEDIKKNRKIARELDAMNRERQTIQQDIVAEAEQRAGTEFADVPGIVLFGDDWHPGVVGIVASRVARRFHKPCVILGSEGDTAKGSSRSIPTVNLVEVLERCSDLLDSWGGHPMAAGVSLQTSRIPEFTRRYLEVLQSLHPDGFDEPSLKLSAWVSAEELNEHLLQELDQLHPFGQENSEPVFGLRAVTLHTAPLTFGNNHFRFNLPVANGRTLSGIAWSMESIPGPGRAVDMAARFSWNCWNNRRTPQLTLVDWHYT